MLVFIHIPYSRLSLTANTSKKCCVQTIGGLERAQVPSDFQARLACDSVSANV